MKAHREDREGFLGLVRSADEAVLTTLYRRYTPGLRSLLVRIVGCDQALSDDLVQETWTYALAGLSSFRGEANFSTWLMRIARNRAYTHLRKERSRRERESKYAGRAVARPENCVEIVVLDKLLRNLNDLQRRVIIAYDVEGYNHGEIASALSVPVGTSRSALSRARHRLRKSLA